MKVKVLGYLFLVVFIAACSNPFFPPLKECNFCNEKSCKCDLVSSSGIEMRWVPAGTFLMGSSDQTVQVSFSKGFYISKYLVTQELYEAVMGTNPSYFHGGAGREPAEGEVQGRRPVESVTWFDAVEFCNKLSEMEGLTPVYTIEGRTPPTGYPITAATVTPDWSADGYRLPTNAQWEYAARGGNRSEGYRYSGSDDADEVAWHRENSGWKTREVGKKAPNELGLYDMSGNVWEWCWDIPGGHPSEPVTDYYGPSLWNGTRLIRGGNFSEPPWATVYVFFNREDLQIAPSPYFLGGVMGFRLLCPL